MGGLSPGEGMIATAWHPSPGISTWAMSVTPEKHTAEKHTAEKHTPEKHTPEKHTAEKHTPEIHTPEKHTPEKHTPEKHTPEIHTPEKHTPEKPQIHLVLSNYNLIVNTSTGHRYTNKHLKRIQNMKCLTRKLASW